MAGYSQTFRDFGILPVGLPAPPPQVRAYFSTGRVIGQYIGTILMSLVGLGTLALVALLLPWPLNALGTCAVLMSFGSIVYFATHNDYRWVELSGNALRAGHLYTGRVVERPIAEIASLDTMVMPIRRAETVVIECLLGRIKGVEIRFRDQRTPLRVMRSDPAMTNAQQLIEAVIYRMAQRAEVDAEVVKFNGQPLVRKIHWKGEATRPPAMKTAKVALICLMAMALMFAVILGFICRQEKQLRDLGSVPPQVMKLSALVKQGPGENPHVVLTDFQGGGYIFESNQSGWSQVWIALFPTDPPALAPPEIQVVLSSGQVNSAAALQDLLNSGRVAAICSPTKRTSWGTQLGPELSKANNGLPLKAAWSLEEFHELPSASHIATMMASSAGCFIAAILCAIGAWWTRN